MNKFTELYNELHEPGTTKARIERIQVPEDGFSRTCSFCGEESLFIDSEQMRKFMYVVSRTTNNPPFGSSHYSNSVCVSCVTTVQKIVYLYNKSQRDKR
jgi:hypothetical protein